MKKILVATILLLLLPAIAAGVEIRFREDAVVTSPMLGIGDVAKIRPARAADAFSGVGLFPAPGPGEQRCFSSVTLRAYIRAAIPGEIAFSGPDTVCVRHDAGMVGKNEILEAIDARLAKALAHTRAEKVRFIPRNLPANLTLPKGNVRYDVSFPAPDIVSSRHAAIVVRVDGRTVHNLVVPGEIQAYMPVVVASEMLERGAVITQSQVRTRMENINGLRDPCTDPEEVIGKILRRPIPANRVIGKNDIDHPILVERRQVVTMVASKGTLEISTQGQAMSSGKEGDMIMIKNLRSNREVPGRVIGPGLARIEF